MSELMPDFQLRVNGTNVGESVRNLIDAVTYEDNLYLADKLTLQVQDPTMELVDNKLFAEGNLVELLIGYDGDYQEMQAFTITQIRPQFPQDGRPMLTIEALDGSSYLMDTAKFPDKATVNGFNYVGMADSDIVVQKANQNWGWLAEVDPTPVPQEKGKEGWRVHSRELKDHEFLSKLAKLNGYELFVDWDFGAGNWKIVFRQPRDADNPLFNLRYFDLDSGSLMSFSPEFSMRGQATEFELTFFNRLRGKVVKLDAPITIQKKAEDVQFVTADRAEITDTLQNGSAVKFVVDGATIDVKVDRAFANDREALTWANQWIKDRARFFVVGNGICVGHPLIRAGQVNELFGVGARFSGKYYMTRTTHKLQKGAPYTIDFSSRKVFEL